MSVASQSPTQDGEADESLRRGCLHNLSKCVQVFESAFLKAVISAALTRIRREAERRWSYGLGQSDRHVGDAWSTLDAKAVVSNYP